MRGERKDVADRISGWGRRVRAAGLAALLAAALLRADAVPALGAVGDGAAALRAALVTYVDGLPEPSNQAERRILERLQRLIADLAEVPEDLPAEVLAVAEAYAALPSSALDDSAVAGAVGALIDAFGPDLAAALDDLDAELAMFPDPPPPLIAAASELVSKSRAKLAQAADPDASDVQRMRALAKAAAKFAAALGKLAEQRASLDDCPPAIQLDTVQVSTVTFSLNGGDPVTVTRVLTAGRGGRTRGDFNATIYDTAGNFNFVVRDAPLRPGDIQLTADDEFTSGVYVRFFQGGAAQEHVADTGAFRITAIELKRYPPPTQGSAKKYLRLSGTFSGSGYLRSNPAQRTTIEAEFTCCEIPYSPPR